MFIRFFKSNNASALVFLPLIAVVIWAFGFFSPVVLPVKHSMPLYELIAGNFIHLPWLGALIGLILVTGEAFILNYIVNENEVLTKQTYLPALFYVLFMSNNKAMLTLHPLIFGNLFILFAIHKLLSSYRKDKAFSQAFDAGLLVSIATLFYFPFIVFLPLLGVGLIILRPFNWREWMISFFGAMIPYIFVITFYFWNEKLDYLFFDKMFYQTAKEKLHPEQSPGFYFMISTGWLIILFSLFKILGGVGIGSQRTKKSIIFLIWFFFFSALSIFLAPEVSTIYFSILAIPTAVFCGNYFANIKKEWWAEFLFITLMVSLFINLLV
jgi:uncharacterized protein DUF6427